jgi:hypothetical protein
MEFSPEDSPP